MPVFAWVMRVRRSNYGFWRFWSMADQCFSDHFWATSGPPTDPYQLWVMDVHWGKGRDWFQIVGDVQSNIQQQCCRFTYDDERQQRICSCSRCMEEDMAAFYRNPFGGNNSAAEHSLQIQEEVCRRYSRLSSWTSMSLLISLPQGYMLLGMEEVGSKALLGAQQALRQSERRESSHVQPTQLPLLLDWRGTCSPTLVTPQPWNWLARWS